MLSPNILRFFPDPQTPKIPKTPAFSPQPSEISSLESLKQERDKTRSTYNKTAYDRDAVAILLMKFRMNTSLFGRISSKDVAMAKALYACLSNTKKIQYKHRRSRQSTIF
jgi:hypothetical protein